MVVCVGVVYSEAKEGFVGIERRTKAVREWDIEKRQLGRGNSMCKGLAVGLCLAHWKNSNEASVDKESEQTGA